MTFSQFILEISMHYKDFRNIPTLFELFIVIRQFRVLLVFFSITVDKIFYALSKNLKM